MSHLHFDDEPFRATNWQQVNAATLEGLRLRSSTVQGGGPKSGFSVSIPLSKLLSFQSINLFASDHIDKREENNKIIIIK